ncbi:MAG: aminotransferase class IV [Bacteroidota bacterium]
MSDFINHNGNIVSSEQLVITVNNRSFRYGDGLFETIRIANGKSLFVKEHLQRLAKGAEVFKMQLSEIFNPAFIEKIIFELAQKNKVTDNGRVRLSIYRNHGGYYAPTDNTVSYVLEVSPLEEQGYVLNSKGYSIDLFTEFRKPHSPLSSIKSANSAIYVLAGIYKNQHQLDECLLQNDKGHIIETISSNLFAVKNGVLYTSPVSDGCVDGVMRKKIIEIAQANRIAVYEITIMQHVLLGADELFLTNVINGIRWVVAYKQKRYFNNTSKKLIEKLNRSIL